MAREPEKPALTLSMDQINQASPDTLRAMVVDLNAALQDARTDSAHQRLQHQMLTIESAEAVERIQVEMDMAQAELNVLQSGDQTHQSQEQTVPSPVKVDADPNVRSVHVDLYNAMVHEIHYLKMRNNHHESTIAHQKRMIVQQEGEIASMTDRIGLYRERLKENRDHLNHYRRGASAAPGGTPRSETRTLNRPQHRDISSTHSRDVRPFDALLHATDIMTHAAPAMPSTPKRKRDYISSMPSTPQTVQPRMNQIHAYKTPVSDRSNHHLKVPMSAPPPRMASLTKNNPPPSAQPQRGHESDGTVSASDDSEAETEVPDQEDVRQSKAARHAGEMLRSPSRQPTPQQQRTVSGGHFLSQQSKLFGQMNQSGQWRAG